MQRRKWILVGVVGLVGLAVSGFFWWRTHPKSPGVPVVKIAFMDIGQGDATLVTFSNGEKLLVDCARDAVVLAALGRNVKWNDRTIDRLVVTHPDADHYGGCIDVLTRYRVQKIYFNGFAKNSSQLLESFHEAVRREVEMGAEFIIVSSTVQFTVAGTTVRFLYPDHDIGRDPRVPGQKKIDSNNTSIVTKISYGTEDVLLTGDMEMPLENYLLKTQHAGLASEILKVGHHGSRSSSGEAFVRAVAPQHAIISSGKNNSYGHPHRAVLYRLQRLGVKMWRTNRGNDILATLIRRSTDNLTGFSLHSAPVGARRSLRSE